MNRFRPRWESVTRLGMALVGGLLVCVTLVMWTGEIGACQTAPVAVAQSKSTSLDDSEEVMSALRGAGGFVRPAGEFSEPFFQVAGQVVNVEGTLLLVFEYPSERDRQGASQRISADGSSVGGTDVTWTGQPNFWASGRVIVQYLGNDRAILSLLHNALGTPITTHEQLSASGKY